MKSLPLNRNSKQFVWCKSYQKVSYPFRQTHTHTHSSRVNETNMWMAYTVSSPKGLNQTNISIKLNIVIIVEFALSSYIHICVSNEGGSGGGGGGDGAMYIFTSTALLLRFLFSSSLNSVQIHIFIHATHNTIKQVTTNSYRSTLRVFIFSLRWMNECPVRCEWIHRPYG